MAGIEAIIMAGGRGTRLHPYTAVLPKPLMPLGDAPVLELLLRQLRSQGVRQVCLAVNHLRHLIQAFFGDGSSLGLQIHYAVEDRPLGTCGPVGTVLGQMQDDFLLLNGDLLTDMDFAALLASHRARLADVTVASVRRVTRIEYGVLDTDEDGRLLGIREKPAMEHLISMGVYALRRDALLPHVVPDQRLDMPDLVNAMMQSGARVDCHATDCSWLDIGRPEDYAAAQRLVSEAVPVMVQAGA
jgi:NDP-sugar pyrophosphorylase family protein